MTILWREAELAALFGTGADITGISIDSRTLQPGELFIALQDTRDGHDFVAAAFARGAAAALVSKPCPGHVIQVPDTLKALETLGAAAVQRAAAKRIAITGSVGKTTTKEMLRRALGAFGRVHAAEASFNNHIGVPLTLARMPRDTDFAIFEIGMNHPGEIAPLAALVAPDIAIITCIDRAHLGLMGSEEAIAREKASLYASLRAGGTAVVPGDSGFQPLLRAAIPPGAHALVTGEDAKLLEYEPSPIGSESLIGLASGPVRLKLDAPGAHMVRNAMAVLLAAQALGLDPALTAAALDGFAPYKGRGARHTLTLPQGQVLLFDESYNASRASLRAALAVLRLQPGRHLAALGDMLELGAFADAEHLALRDDVIAACDMVFTSGPHMGLLFDSLPAAKQGAHAPDAASLAPLVKAALRDGDCLLVKGSFGSRMRDVIQALESPG
ncbi:UDP-N-acetylmuramoyl-tripeptide--D-alanyl-D-alanine ligase [Acidocella sp.]|uniref:UDP-N-acetylmuramoyl-tripeptide--D-alanyl-D- alanine ligase n=1 Tax=Acidocella sp. TaxID=50710 RepID=UPI0026017E52|nr:UDP-N-acetylmuramoyl-tripeptide--D-alanyl-D-alanine ligase [Acidocella sp.]